MSGKQVVTIKGIPCSKAHCFRWRDDLCSSSTTMTPTEIFSWFRLFTNHCRVLKTCPPPCWMNQKIEKYWIGTKIWMKLVRKKKTEFGKSKLNAAYVIYESEIQGLWIGKMVRIHWETEILGNSSGILSNNYHPWVNYFLFLDYDFSSSPHYEHGLFLFVPFSLIQQLWVGDWTIDYLDCNWCLHQS